MQRRMFFPTVLAALVMVAATIAGVAIILRGTDDGRTPSGCGDLARNDSVPSDSSISAASCDVGTFVPSQGRNHFPGGFASHTPTPFCDGVLHTNTIGDSTTSGVAPVASPSAVPTNCYLSNPPSSGAHLNVARNVDVGGGKTLNIPPDIDVYPDDVEVPRDAIPHILEHAGVFVGWNCGANDSDCRAFVEHVKGVVNDRIRDDNRVVMAHDNDLPEGEIGMSAWTRVDRASYKDFTDDRTTKFIKAQSCRFDPEGFCR